MTTRNNWAIEEIKDLFELNFMDLLYQAHNTHRAHFNPNQVQLSTLLNIKSGACPEDCSYCPQSAHYKTDVEKYKLMSIEEIISAAKLAKEMGATRFCMGAAWRSPPKKEFLDVVATVKAVKELEMEVCVTLGMLTDEQISILEQAGLDFYNHNLDSSPEFYEAIISTRRYEDRIATLQRLCKTKIKVCCGGIVGMGETRLDRMKFLQQLVNLPKHPESVPINHLVRIDGTPLAKAEQLDSFEFIRMIAVARIMMPASYVRLSAGRESMSDEMQALCFFAGANSIHYGEKLLATNNPAVSKDQAFFKKLGINSYVESI